MSSTGSGRRDGRERLLDRIGAGLVAGSSGPMRTPDARIGLSLRLRADLVATGAGIVGEVPADLSRVWQAVQVRDGRMVVLGPPGAGKTAMALELVSVSLARARASRREPIPILLDLVEWRRGGGIDRWLLDGLRDHYGVPIRFGAKMVERNELLVLADSFDAVPEPDRARCAAQFVALSRERPALGVILLSRTAEYEGLPAGLPWPTVEVATPTPAQVVRYTRRARLNLGKAGEPKPSGPYQPMTPQALQLLAIAGPRGASGFGTDRPAPSSWIAIRAFRRWLDSSEDRAASEPLVRLIAAELRSNGWWAASLGRLASTGLSQPRLRRMQRMLIIAIATLVGSAIGLAIGAAIDAARTILAPDGSTLLTWVLLGALMAVADAIVTDAALFGRRDPERPGSPGRPATARAGSWLVRLAAIVALPAGAVALRAVVGEPTAIVAVGAFLGALTGVTSRRLPCRDSVRWSWRSFSRKLLVRLAGAGAAGSVGSLLVDHSESLLAALGLGLGSGVTSGIVGGFKRRIAPLAQHGPPSAMRIGRLLAGGAAIVLAAGTATGLIALTSAPVPGGGDPARWLAAGYLAALVTGATASALAVTLYGGLELLERWTLASVLAIAGIARRPVGRSLEELCDGMLLRPAGAGVAFIHRPVLDVLVDGTASRAASDEERGDATYQAIPR